MKGARGQASSTTSPDYDTFVQKVIKYPAFDGSSYQASELIDYAKTACSALQAASGNQTQAANQLYGMSTRLTLGQATAIVTEAQAHVC